MTVYSFNTLIDVTNVLYSSIHLNNLQPTGKYPNIKELYDGFYSDKYFIMSTNNNKFYSLKCWKCKSIYNYYLEEPFIKVC